MAASFPAKWAPYLQSIARIIFGFLLLRHGMEQVLGYPEASGAARLSYEGILELIAFPAGLLIMLGLFTRQSPSSSSVMYFILFFVGPLQRGPYTHRNGGDPILLNGFFFLYLAAAGGGAWSLDRLLRPASEASADARWAPYALGILRIGAGCLFIMHGLEKFFSVGGGRIDRDIMTMRGLAGWLEMRRRAAHHPRPLHASGRVHPLGRDGGGLLQIVGAERVLAELPAAGHGSLDSVLLLLPVPVGGRPRGLESRRVVAA